MMISLFVSVGLISGLTAGVSSAPTTGPVRPVVFLDRFGNTWFHGRIMESQVLISVIEREKNNGGEVTVVFEPFSLEPDRQQVADLLKRTFPDRRIKLQPVRSGDGFEKLIFPRHHPDVQDEVFSRRNMIWEEFARHNRQLADQVQLYLTAFFSQWSKARSDISTLEHEYQHLTTRSSGKTSRP